VQGLGGGSGNLLQSVGNAYKNALDDTSANAVPLFGVFLGAIILAIGAFVLWLEMIIRDAAIYISLFFLPLTFVAMIWPATSRWARRLVEFLVAVILAKFVIVAIIGLASAAITQTSLAQPGDGSVFERMIAGAALLVLAAWSPFGLLRLIPMMEVAAASMGGQRAAIGNATTSAGTAQNTVAGFRVKNLEREMEELRSSGVTFEEYDFPGLKTEKGIATFEGGRGAWFKDPDGNIFALTQDA
jgi:predicted enzyme related to lactoylglutathione lyase